MTPVVELRSTLTCPHCGGAMRILAFVTQASVIAQILTYLRTRAPVLPPSSAARSPPARRTAKLPTR